MKTFSIPKEMSPELIWFVAAILCDGHLRKQAKGIVFEVGDKTLAEKFALIFSKVFLEKEPKIIIRHRIGYNQTFAVYIYNKKICNYLSNCFNIPFGKKCNIIRVPEQIFSSSVELKKAFLKGVFDTDGGKRGKGLGLTSLSEKFVIDVSNLLTEFGIKTHKDMWINKRYDKKCYGVRFKIDPHSIFLLREKQSFYKNE